MQSTVTLYPGDNRISLQRLIDDGVRVHSVVTDPPYGLVSVQKRFGKEGSAAARTEGNDGSFARLSGGFMGKCFHPDTEILTASGWMKVDEIEVGDIVATLNPISRSTEWQAVAQTHSYPFDGDLVHVKHRSAEQMITPNHKVLVSHDGGESLDLLTPRELKNSFHLFAQSAPQIGRNDDVVIRSVMEYGKDRAECRKSEARFAPSAFFRFFGLWLGDGYSVVRSDDHPANDFFGINVKKKRKLDAVRSALLDLGIKFTESPATSGFTAFYCYDFALLGWLKLLGGAKEKRIPTFLFEWDAAHLEHLYQGLMDSDGCRQGKNQEVFQTSSRQLADDFQRLCFATGRSCAITLRPGGKDVVICGHKTVSSDAWVCCVLQQGKRMYGENSTRSSNVLHSVPYAGDVFCVGVPEHHIIYTRFNGKPVWSGNSWDATGIERDPDFWKLIYDILLPGGYVFAFSGSRTGHWQACAMETAGFVMHPMHGWVFGCLDTETLAATPDGDKPYTELSTGDEVICYDPTTGEYSVQPILEVVEYDYEDTAYRLIGDHGEQVVSRNHRCIVERDGNEVFHFSETLEQQEVIPVLEDLRGLREALRLQGYKSDTKPSVFKSLQGCSALAGPRPDASSSSDGSAQGENGRLPNLLDASLETGRLAAEDSGNSVLQPILSGEGDRTEVARPTLAQRASHLDGCQHGVFPCENDRLEEPLLEGRCDSSQQEGQSRSPVNQVYSLSAASEQHVPQGRLCDGTSDRSSEGDWKAAAALGGGASHQPRRDGQQDHQPDAVCDQCGTQTVRAWAGHKTDLVRVVPFQYVGKVWCLRVPTGAFVAVRNGVAFPTGNSGFPKAHNASKAIVKALRQQGDKGAVRGASGSKRNSMAGDFTGGEYHDYLPATEEAAQWEGWAYGTQTQKPALEPIYLGQKPFSEKTGAANLLTHGVGAVNIDGCRVPVNPEADASQLRTMQRGQRTDDLNGQEWGMSKGGADTPQVVRAEGRHPANLILDGSSEVVSMFPDSKGQQGDLKGHDKKRQSPNGVFGEMGAAADHQARNDSGSAARFFHQFTPDADPLFYHPKAGKLDRAGSKHPTVKPIALMQYLIRHITPPGGIVLDPFAGSGTTAEAARREGFDVILMEAEQEYVDFLNQRFNLGQAERSDSLTDLTDLLDNVTNDLLV